MQTKNLMGKTFGELTVVSGPEQRRVNGVSRIFWVCRCSCGELRTVQAQVLHKSNRCQTCKKIKLAGDMSKRAKTHGMRHTRTYRIWIGMKNRCTNPNNYSYAYYGGRGITLCDKWMKFEGFFEDMGDAPENLTLDRLDGNSGYSKGNCRWATQRQQMQNVSTNHNISFNGETKCIREWARTLGISRSAIERRIARGLPIEKVLHNKSRLITITFEGVTMRLTEWAKFAMLDGKTLAKRLRDGWSIEDTILTPLCKNGSSRK